MLFRVFTVFAVVGLCVVTWMQSSPARRPPAQANAALAELPGYFLKHAVLTDYDLEGNANIRIEAERIDQIAHGNEVALYNVRVAYQADGGDTWNLLGDVAHVQPGGKVIDVSGNVRLEGEPGGREAVVHTDTLRYDVPDAIASTKDDVRIDFGEHVLTARGMVANLKERTMRLESKVNGRIHP
jgi:LPS export ABC transporter protein LptC